MRPVTGLTRGPAASQAGALAGAAWAPDSRTLLVAAAGAPQLAALCLTRPAPALDAQLLPLPLPPPPPRDPAGDAAAGAAVALRVAGFAWDAAAQRLAVAARCGRVAVYATVQRPVLAARLLGCLPRPGPRGGGAERKRDAHAGPAAHAAPQGSRHEGDRTFEGGSAAAGDAGADDETGGRAGGEGPCTPVLDFQRDNILAVRWDEQTVTLHDCTAGF